MTQIPSLRLIHKLSPQNRDNALTPAQRLLYTSEKATNFRTIARMCGTRSTYVLGVADLASAELEAELAQLGQFAEVAYCLIEPAFVFEHLETLLKPGFPLEGYDALGGTVLLSTFPNHPGIVAYRTSTRQLVVGFSGTTTLHQALYDLYFTKHKYPTGRGCMVHHGFWKMYKESRDAAIEGIQRGLKEHDVAELVVTGHSLGGALASLLALDLLAGAYVDVVPVKVALSVVGFGSPRAGNAELVQLWRDAVRIQGEKGRTIREYLVKAYNDGVPALPPASFGYRHFTEQTLYYHHGRLFHVPPSENEHGIFDVKKEAAWANDLPQWPRGGHNYYNGRDLESLARRIHWVDDMRKAGSGEWESGYLAEVEKYESKLKRKLERALDKVTPSHVETT